MSSKVDSKDNEDVLSNNNESFTRRKTTPVFVDEVANISISPNGACRLHLISWQNDENSQPVQINSEIIMTIQSLESLSEALPKAIEAAKKAIASRKSNNTNINTEKH